MSEETVNIVKRQKEFMVGYDVDESTDYDLCDDYAILDGA